MFAQVLLRGHRCSYEDTGVPMRTRVFLCQPTPAKVLNTTKLTHTHTDTTKLTHTHTYRHHETHTHTHTGKHHETDTHTHTDTTKLTHTQIPAKT
jgi:hypothetical protein